MAVAIEKALSALIALLACRWSLTYVAPDFRLSSALFPGHWGAARAAPKVMYILECEGVQEWQAVPAEEAVVSWVGELKDRLTVHKGNPEGEDLTVRLS